jgi:hypothetical protein
MSEDRKALGDKIRVQRLTHSLQLYTEAAQYNDYAKMFKTEKLCLRRGLHLMFKDAAESAEDRAHDAAHGYGYFANENAHTPKECETDAQAFIAAMQKRHTMPREEFRKQVQLYAGKSLDRPRYHMPISERERLNLGRPMPPPVIFKN